MSDEMDLRDSFCVMDLRGYERYMNGKVWHKTRVAIVLNLAYLLMAMVGERHSTACVGLGAVNMLVIIPVIHNLIVRRNRLAAASAYNNLPVGYSFDVDIGLREGGYVGSFVPVLLIVWNLL